jgi:DNA primase
VLKVSGRDSLQGVCPFHEDKNPSLSVGKRGDKWVWNCFGCRAHGNVIDFLMKKGEKSFGDAYQILDVKLNGHITPPVTTTPVKSPAALSVRPSELLARVVEVYHAAFIDSRAAQGYMVGRGIKDAELFRHFKVGYSDGRLRRMLPEDVGHEFVAGLKAVGVLNEKGGEFFHGCVTFPILDDNGAVVGMYGRRAIGQGPAHLYLPGPRRGVWNGAAFKAHREIILTESIIDALSLCALGFTNVVPLYGVNGFTDDHARLMKEHRTAKARLCFDNDAAGLEARARVKEKLSGLGVSSADVFLSPVHKDINDGLVKGMTAEQFGALESPKAEPTAPTAVEATADPTDEFPAVEQKEDGIHFAFEERRYRVRGLSARNLDSMRVNIKMESSFGAHLDTVDLYSSRAREAFVSCCRKITKADHGDLHEELNRMIELLEGIQSGPSGEKEAERGMTAEEEAKALEALKSPTLLRDIIEDMESMGYVGEESNKAIGYLVGVSRKLDDPLSCVIISQSSAGKSVLAETVEKLTPPEEVMLYSRVTTNALGYMKKDALKHKLLILEERVGAEAADYSIRTLQSKKKLVQAVPVKDEKTGRIETKTFEVEGPIAYIETTTRPRIHDENATRCFELYLDESPEQTKRIHESQRRAKTLDGLKEKQVREAIRRRHWNMQRCLKAVSVVIPFADLLEFPASWLRTRRDHLRFLNLIEAICFLHQHQRPTEKADGREYVLATVEDYKAAYGLAGQVMGEGLTELKKPQRKLLEAIQGMDGGNEGVTRREIREKVGLSDTRLRSLLDDLVSLEYLYQVEGGGYGRMCRYRLADLVEGDARRLAGLMSPEELSTRFAVRTSPH